MGDNAKMRAGSSSVQVMVERKLSRQPIGSPRKAQNSHVAVADGTHVVSIQSQPASRRNQALKDENNDHMPPHFNNQSYESQVQVTNEGKVILQRQTSNYGSNRMQEIQISQVDGESGDDSGNEDETVGKQSKITPIPGRRGYMYNEANGQMVRVIRKRKRKTPSQLEELANAFAEDPHWTKETLLEIATATQLTEAQVYKWGWD